MRPVWNRSRFPNLSRLLGEFLEGGDFRAQLFKFQRGRVLIDQLITYRIVEIVFVLLGIRQATLQSGQPFGALGRSETLKLFQEIFLLLQPPLDRLVNGAGGAHQPSLQDSSGQRRGGTSLPVC